MEARRTLNQTAKNDEINSSQENKIDLKNEIHFVWQDLQDLFRNRTLPVLDFNLPLAKDILERHALAYAIS